MNHDLAQFTERVKQQARQEGFTLVGVTSPDPPAHLDSFIRWIEAGRQGSMHYLGSERAQEARADLRLLLPECQSILVVAMDYLTRPEPDHSPGQARIAAYALGQDYHHVLETRLRGLVGAIEDLIGSPFPHRIYVDTGPLLERELAQRAGLGWIGKNTCLIHPGRGSYFVIGEILLGIELQPDKPIPHDYCGSCTRCIEACPTGCILPDRTIDARRCISYLTIESRDAVPYELRPLMGSWVFGCDLCQEVCPWNQRFSKLSTSPEFQPRSFLERPLIEDILRLSLDSYRSLFRNSPLKRPKLQGMIRNALIAAGNSADARLVTELTRWLHCTSEPLLSMHAAWALGQMKHPCATAILLRAIEIERDPAVLSEIDRAIEKANPTSRESCHKEGDPDRPNSTA